MPLYEPVSSPDRLLRFSFPAAGVRGQIIRLEHGWTEVARRHRTHEAREVSPNPRQRLGELTAAGLLLSASLKFDGSLVLLSRDAGATWAVWMDVKPVLTAMVFRDLERGWFTSAGGRFYKTVPAP